MNESDIACFLYMMKFIQPSCKIINGNNHGRFAVMDYDSWSDCDRESASKTTGLKAI